MKETVERSIEAEEKKMGLIIVKALYGKLQATDDGWVDWLHSSLDTLKVR